MSTNVQRDSFSDIAELAAQLRVDSIRSSTAAGSGHTTSSMSAADVLAVLISRHLRYDWDNPKSSYNDHLIYSKGHASPLVYSVLKAAGQISDDEMVTGYRQFGQRLQGHPTPELPWIDVATGSLGQGLPDGVGIALAGKYLDKLPYTTWVLCGDSEMAEGSIWEALDKASYYELDNLVVVVDVNRLGQTGPTEHGWDIETYMRRAESFGAAAVKIDGHDLHSIDDALAAAGIGGGRPTVILAQTIKGKGFSEIEDKDDWHGKPLPEDAADRAISELGGERDLRVLGLAPEETGEPHRIEETQVQLPSYEIGDEVATRQAYSDALVALGHSGPRVVALDAEVGNSTHTDDFGEAFPERYFQMFIAEQQLIAAATGLNVRGYKAYASTYAAFLTRAFDFIRMAAISGADLRIAGSHAGVEIGPDGPSQMGVEDLAMFRSVHGSTVVYPSDAVSAAALTAQMADRSGINYLRATRGTLPVIYSEEEKFPIGGAKTLRAGDDDEVTLIGAGVTLHECLAAADALSEKGISARVVDCYSVKPLDAETLRGAVMAAGGNVVIAEDHHPEGGLGEAVVSVLAGQVSPLRVTHLAVEGMPGSGTSAELLDWAGIDAQHIVEAAEQQVANGGSSTI